MSVRIPATFWLAAVALWAMPMCAAAGPASAPAPETRPVRSADEADVEGHRIARDGGALADGWIRTIGAMAAVVVLILLVRWGLRKLAPAAVGGRGGRGLDVLAVAGLSPRHQLRLVRIGRRVVLVGLGPEGLAALTEITDPDEVADLLAEAGGKKPASPAAGPADGEGTA